MAGSKSDFLELKLLDHVLGNTAYTAPTIVYVALYTVAPTDAGGGTEVTGGAYARVAVTNNITNWPAAAGGLKSNGTEIVFPTATASWGTVVAFAVLDAPMDARWVASTAYALGAYVRPTTPNGFRYECTTAGTSGTTEPVWPTTLGSTVTDGTAVWTCRADNFLYWADLTISKTIASGDTAKFAIGDLDVTED